MVRVYANPKCARCLGTGFRAGFRTHWLQREGHVCDCVTEQLEIVRVLTPDCSIPASQRYMPGLPKIAYDQEDLPAQPIGQVIQADRRDSHDAAALH